MMLPILLVLGCMVRLVVCAAIHGGDVRNLMRQKPCLLPDPHPLSTA